MSNTNLTDDKITRAALVILHQKLTFLGAVNRQYDDSFAQSGAKIGSSLRIRLPNQYTVRTGKVMDVQDVAEQKETLTVATQKGVDTSWTSEELAMDIDDFSERILDPAMSVLASVIEADVLQTVTKDIYQLVDNDAGAISLLNVLRAGEKLDDSLTPQDGRRTCLLSTNHQVVLVDALKGLFQSSEQIASQYREGVMGRAAGFTFAASTHAADHTTGTAVKGDSLYNVNGANQTGSTLTVDTGTTTFLAGDVITLGINAVHPETKVDTGKLQQFVITADSGASATSLSISPEIVTSGARQNVTGSPADNDPVLKIGAGVSEKLNGSLAYHEDAFTFVTADLVMPRGTDMASRQVLEGISMRLVRDFDIKNDEFPVRFDVLYGFKTLRRQLACRIHADG